MFRKFRDEWLITQPDGERLVKRYYQTAPDIVSKINLQTNRSEIYMGLNEKYLQKCLNHIEHQEYEECKDIYSNMMQELFKESQKWQ